MKIQSYGISDVGMRREKNEDAFLIDDSLGLYVVADGMGGHQGGEYASRLAVSTIEEGISQYYKSDLSLCKQVDFKKQLRQAILLASQRIYESALQDIRLKGMGTTAVVLLARGNKIYLANVGDSRAYVVRKRRMRQITEDHSLVQEQLKAGVISEKDARAHRLKNIITRSVGFQEDVDIDVDVRVVRVGDKYILCTDGLTNMVSDDEIFQVITDEPIQVACQRLIDLANGRGGEDNITVVVAEVVELDPEDQILQDESTVLSD